MNFPFQAFLLLDDVLQCPVLIFQFFTSRWAEAMEGNKTEVSRNIYCSLSMNSYNIFFSFEIVGFLIGNKHLLKHVHQPSCYLVKKLFWKNWFWCLGQHFLINMEIQETVLRCVSLYWIMICSVCRKCPCYQ